MPPQFHGCWQKTQDSWIRSHVLLFTAKVVAECQHTRTDALSPGVHRVMQKPDNTCSWWAGFQKRSPGPRSCTFWARSRQDSPIPLTSSKLPVSLQKLLSQRRWITSLHSGTLSGNIEGCSELTQQWLDRNTCGLLLPSLWH